MHLVAFIVATVLCIPILRIYGRYFDQAMIVLGKIKRGEPLDEDEGALIGNAEDTTETA